MVAVGTPLIQYGLDRLLHVLGQHGHVLIQPRIEDLRRTLDAGQVGVLLCDRTTLEQLDAHCLQEAGAKVVLVMPADFPPADLPIEQWPLCGLLPHRASESQTLALLDTLLACGQEPGRGPSCQHCPMRHSLSRQALPLSPREMDVFRAIGQGAGPSEIAQRCGLSVKTVEGYRERIKVKLQLDGREALLLAARRWNRGFRLSQAGTVVAGGKR